MKMSTKNIMKNIFMVYRELFRYSKPARWQFPVYAMFRIISPLIVSTIPALAVALLTQGDLTGFVLGISVLLFIYMVISGLCIVLENRCNQNMTGTRLNTFVTRLLRKCLTMDFCNLESADKQKKMFRALQTINNNTRGVEGMTRYSFQLFYGLFGLVSYGSIMFTIHWSILLIVAATTVITFFLKCHAINYYHKLSGERYEAGRINAMLEQQGISLAYGKDIRVYHVENWFRAIFEEQFRILRRTIAKQELRWYFPTVGEQIGNFVRDFVMYFILIHMVLDGRISVAQFTFYVSIVGGFSIWLNETINHMSQVMYSNVELGYYSEAMDTPDVFLHGEGEKPDLSSAVAIEFRDVSFCYEEGGKEILSHLSFRIEPGQKVALVGNNGAGKTTIVKLLCGLYMPTEGEVLVNGINTKDYDMDEYGKLISPVFQDGFMSAFTVAMNVAGGREADIDRERVRQCLKEADMWDKINSLDQKEDTYISQVLEKEGVNFSGGEMQKLLVARALYKDGRCLILDEPTSALDPIAESRIYEQYSAMAKGKTSIFISHRLASTRFCDEILYLENGKLAEQGTHEELLRQKGAYAEMFEIQSYYYYKQKREETSI